MAAAMHDAGHEVEYVVTYLEMTRRPGQPAPPLPAGANAALITAQRPPVDYFLYLYGTVGAAYAWLDWFEAPRAELDAFLDTPGVTLTTMLLDGFPGGFFVLDTRIAGVCDLAILGLVPQAVGRGLGRWLTATAIRVAWDRPGVERVTVNTCTLDHPRALGLYQKNGFTPVGRETRRRILDGTPPTPRPPTP